MAVPSGPRYPYWIQEQSSEYRGPTMSGILFVAVLVVLVALALAGGPLASAQGGGQAVEREQGSFCEIHRGKPAWDAICEETRQMQRR